MIAYTPTFETLAYSPIKQTDVIVVRQTQDPYGYYDDTTAQWTSSDLLMEVKIDAIGQILGAATKKATVKLLGIVDGVKAKELFQVRLGLYDGAAFDYISEGFFLVDTIEYDYDSGFTVITMYDHMWTAGKSNYSDTVASNLIEYPITVEDFATKIANLLGIELMSGFSSLPNASYEIQQDLYTSISGATLQTAIQDIAGATGTTARISDTTLVFSQYDITDESLDSANLKTLKIGDTYGPITSVVLGRVPQNDNIAIFAANPQSNIVENINTTTNILTITDHGMIDGNMVRFQSTTSLPAPLQVDTHYYVHTSDTDTFSLAPTYLDAIAGSNLIDFTSTGSGTISIVPFVTKEIQINNNEILDDDRQTLLPPLYNTLSGIKWTDVKADTTGFGWHEVGDVVTFVQGSTEALAFISEIHIVLSGSIKENIISTVPDVASINYAAAGGVLKSIYNTEIKVDKQNQTITSIVSRQDELEGSILEDFSQISQDVDDVLITIQKAGGGNLLLNSVGYAKESTLDDDGVSYAKLLYWDYPASYAIADHGAVTSYDSSESQNYGGVSGRVIQISTDYLAPETMTLTQRVNVAVGIPLSFGLRVRNETGMGDATITLSNDTDSFVINIDDSVNRVWQEFTIVNFVTTMPWLDVTIEATAASFRFTDLRLLYGATLQGWVQSNAEILDANVQFTKDGMRIFDGSHDTETRVTYNEFSTRRRTDGVVLFEADDTGVVTNDITIKGSTSYEKSGNVIIKQVTIGSGSMAGIAFIKGSGA